MSKRRNVRAPAITQSTLRSVSDAPRHAAAILAAAALLVGCPGETKTADDVVTQDVPSDCAKRAFEATVVQEQVRPHVVRVVAGDSVGTGFIVEAAGDGVHIVTNYHVIAEADKIAAIFSVNGKDAEVGGVEVAKVDTKNDLALLKAPNMSGKTDSLKLNRGGVTLGQRIAAMGYPWVAGTKEFTLTFEPGDVSAVKQVIQDREFVQTNANINPGNSGGPVVDACATVVGVVVATSTSTQRVGLVVPVQRLAELYDAYRAPAKPAKEAITERVHEFEKAVRYRKGNDAAAFFSRGFMRDVVVPTFAEVMQGVWGKEEFYAQQASAAGYDYEHSSLEQRASYMANVLPREDFDRWLLAQQLIEERIGRYEALHQYLALWVTDAFGEVTTMEVEELAEVTDEKGTVHLKVVTPQGPSFWEFEMKREWGDWHIEKTACVRACQ
jgi:S1-C subfamily serine protease